MSSTGTNASKLKAPTKREEFKVHTTSLLKRKQLESAEDENAPVRNTRARTSGTSSSSSGFVAGKNSVVAGKGTAKTAPATTRTAATTRAAPKTKTATAVVAGNNPRGPIETAAKKQGTAPAKRPAWDVKGRLQDLEEHHASTNAQLAESTKLLSTMTHSLESSQQRIEELLRFKDSLESEVSSKQTENKEMNQELSRLREKLENVQLENKQELEKAAARASEQIQALEARVALIVAERDQLKMDLEIAKNENQQLKTTISSTSTHVLQLEADLRAAKYSIEAHESTIKDKTEKINQLEKELAQKIDLIEQLDAKSRHEETIRRQLHNKIQELKGNIRVFCRVRPCTATETNALECHEEEGSLNVAQPGETSTLGKIQKTYPFSFDRVFGPATSQATVFGEISQLVQSALDGYHVCIFAYGQTGSGKSFTMEGPEEFSEEQRGMIPRSVDQVFEASASLKEKGWEYSFVVQYLEIYNETIRDLLSPDEKKHDIKHVNGKTSVTDVVNVPVSASQDIAKLLTKAAQNRAVAATNCNERSSRSHSVFTLKIDGNNAITGEKCEGTLNLIDLAGSERLSVSGSTGDRLKETQAINKSLSSLGDVIYALGQKDAFVPYRNSKLTYLLQNSLGGNSKTLMFVNVSPSADSVGETLCSLRFATKVNSCQIGTARKNVKSSSS